MGAEKEKRKMLSVAEQGNMSVMPSGRIKLSMTQLWVSQLLCIFEAMATIWGK